MLLRFCLRVTGCTAAAAFCCSLRRSRPGVLPYFFAGTAAPAAAAGDTGAACLSASDSDDADDDVEDAEDEAVETLGCAAAAPASTAGGADRTTILGWLSFAGDSLARLWLLLFDPEDPADGLCVLSDESVESEWWLALLLLFVPLLLWFWIPRTLLALLALWLCCFGVGSVVVCCLPTLALLAVCDSAFAPSFGVGAASLDAGVTAIGADCNGRLFVFLTAALVLPCLPLVLWLDAAAASEDGVDVGVPIQVL